MQNPRDQQLIAQLDDVLSPKTQTRLFSDSSLNMLLLRTQEVFISKHSQLDRDMRAETASLPSTVICYPTHWRVPTPPPDAPAEKRPIRASDHQKTRPQAHGVGLKSIERIVQRYGGIQTMYYDSEEHRSHHVIHFPL